MRPSMDLARALRAALETHTGLLQLKPDLPRRGDRERERERRRGGERERERPRGERPRGKSRSSLYVMDTVHI